MCCWGYKDVYLEDPPPKKAPEENKNTYILVPSAMPTAQQPPKPPWVPMPAWPAPAPQPAAPKNAWVRLREAQDEAVRNAQPAPLQPAPAAPAASPVAVAVPIAAPVATLEPVKGYYYYYPQPVYAPPAAMIAHPFYHGQPTIVYQQPAQAAEPAKPEEPILTGDPKQEFYCRELDGSWSLRTATAITKDCHPGFWQSSESGYPVFYRTMPS